MLKVPRAVKHEFLLFVPVCCTSVPKRPRFGKRSRQDTTSIHCTEGVLVQLSTTSEYDSGHRKEKKERQGKKDFFSPSLALLALLRLKTSLCVNY